MLIALLSDIHSNREAFEACLAAAKNAGAEKYVILGDIVGYGADPEWCVDKCQELQTAGAILVRGNHDQAVNETNPSFTKSALTCLVWTRYQLDEADRNWLGQLPLTVTDENRLYVHADASSPADWNYVHEADNARQHFNACPADISFCGHIHRPAIYSQSSLSKVTAFTPNSANPVPLLSGRKWLCVLGSVGQPRDANPAAAFCLYDTNTRNIRYMRTTYDVQTAVAKIKAAGLPTATAERLLKGK